MVFSSHIFIFYYLPLLLLVYYNLPHRWRNAFLALMSYVFYGWWKPWFGTLMLATTVVNYACGKIIAAPGASRRMRATALAAACAVSLGLLAFFKYYMFAAGGLNSLLAVFGADALPVLRVTLPIGISFFTFQAISYTVDVYRREAAPAGSFVDFACFVSMFPQLIAGPIIRYHTVADQLVRREYTLGRFSSGVAIFVLGLAKKVLLANSMGEVADAVFGAAGPCAADAWFGILAYAFQIYFDFCGYSDMAVGLGRMLGFEFPKNFDAPYLADSITDLWRRWHISLSTFLRDYLYIPLGGNRRGPGRTYLNLAVVMLLGGLWHGAKWTFLAWGAYHGVLLALERWRGKRSPYAALPRPVRVAATFLLMLFSWVLFRSEGLGEAGGYFLAMMGLGDTTSGSLLLAAELYTVRNVALLAVCAALTIQPVQAFDWAGCRPTLARSAVLLLLFVLSLAVMSAQAFNPFLYFQF
ncbi:MAG: MBOAT family O-acyltransferase [Phycisphaerae bacterium]